MWWGRNDDADRYCKTGWSGEVSVGRKVSRERISGQKRGRIDRENTVSREGLPRIEVTEGNEDSETVRAGLARAKGVAAGR